VKVEVWVGNGVFGQLPELLVRQPEGASKVIELVLDTPPREAVTMADWLEVTELAVAVKVAEEDVAATVTEAGTVRAALLEESATEEPPVGAGCMAILNALSDALGDEIFRRAPVTADVILTSLEAGKPVTEGLTAHI
jgi:hypothetical protein